MDMKTTVMKQTHATKKRNPIATSLKNRRYKQTIINSKKLYNRKEKKNEIIKEF